MSTLLELAEVREKAAQYVQALEEMNAHGRTPAEEVEYSARYQLAQDAWMKAEQDYRNAIRGMTNAQLINWLKGKRNEPVFSANVSIDRQGD